MNPQLAQNKLACEPSSDVCEWRVHEAELARMLWISKVDLRLTSQPSPLARGASVRLGGTKSASQSCQPFIHSFIYSFSRSVSHLLTHTFIYSFIQPKTASHLVAAQRRTAKLAGLSSGICSVGLISAGEQAGNRLSTWKITVAPLSPLRDA